MERHLVVASRELFNPQEVIVQNEPEVNFRLATRFHGEEKELITTLSQFLLDNEGAPAICDVVKALEPGQEIDAGALHIRRFPQNEVRFSHFKVPVRFDGATSATVTIDRKRLIMSIRPARRRQVREFDLATLVEKLLWQSLKLDLAAKKKARKAARLARRKAA